MAHITYDMDRDLKDFFSGVFAASMGLRSTMGGKLDSARLGAIVQAGGAYEMDERALYAACESGRVTSVLCLLPEQHVMALADYYRPLSRGETEWLEAFGRHARVAVRIAGDRDRLVALCKRARRTRDRPADPEAKSAMCRISHQASSLVVAAQGEYQRQWDRSHPKRVICRPWYADRKEDAA